MLGGERKTINALLAALNHNTSLIRLAKYARIAGEAIKICEFVIYVRCLSERYASPFLFLYGLQ